MTKDLANIVATDMENILNCVSATVVGQNEIRKYRDELNTIVTIVRTMDKELISVCVGEEEDSEVLYQA